VFHAQGDPEIPGGPVRKNTVGAIAADQRARPLKAGERVFAEQGFWLR
jgi:hypothetical protein